MKRAIFALTTCLMALPVAAEEFRLDADVSAAVIFRSGGKITRSISADLPTGLHELVVSLPRNNIQQGRFRVLMPEGSGLSLISTTLRGERQLPMPKVENEAVVDARAKLEQAKADLRGFDLSQLETRAKKRSAELRLQLLSNIAEGKAPLMSEDTRADASQFGAHIAELGAQITAAERDLVEAIEALKASDLQRVKLSEDVTFAQAMLNASQLPDTPNADLVLSVDAREAFKGNLTLEHMTKNAFWIPDYQVDLAQDRDKGALTLTRRALVSQATGEDWNDVDVTLSTAAIAERMSTLPPRQVLQFLVNPQLQRGVSKNIVSADMAQRELGESAMMSLAPPAAEPLLKGQTLEFRLTKPVTLQSELEGGALLPIDQLDLDIDLFAKANAQRDAKAYLYADIKNSTGGTLLAGAAQIYRDGAYIGEVNLPQITNGDSEDISFGPLDGLLVERRTISREDGDRGILTSSNARELRFETTLTSLLNYPIGVQVFDNIPVSESEDLKINEVVSPKPNGRDVDGQRGVLRWDFEMKPGAVQKLRTGYDMAWPTGQNIGTR